MARRAAMRANRFRPFLTAVPEIRLRSRANFALTIAVRSWWLYGRLRVWRSRGGVAASPEEWRVRLSSAARRGGPVDDEGADDVGVAYAND